MRPIQLRALHQIIQRAKRPALALRLDDLDLLRAEAVHIAQAQANGIPFNDRLRLRVAQINRQELHACAQGIVDDDVLGIEAHRLMAQQAREESRGMVAAQPGRPVGDDGEGRRVGL